jgi:hypothetical protein
MYATASSIKGPFVLLIILIVNNIPLMYQYKEKEKAEKGEVAKEEAAKENAVKEVKEEAKGRVQKEVTMMTTMWTITTMIKVRNQKMTL